MFDGIITGYLLNFFNFPPLLPEKQAVKIFFLFASLNASIKFWLLPDVVRAIAISPVFPIASNCLEKIYLKPKSLPDAVMADVSAERARPEIAFLFFFHLLVLLEM